MIKKSIVSRDDDVYEAFPDVVYTKKQTMICVFAECTHHADRSYTKIVYKISKDKGNTWGEKNDLTRAKHGFPYYNCPRISQLSDGRVVIVCDQCDNEEERYTRNDLWFSDDEGSTWSDPIETPAKGIVPDKLNELSTGRWLLSVQEKNKRTGYLEQKLWYSDDKGKTWSDPICVAEKKGLNLCEVSIIELNDHTLIAFMRENSGNGYDCYKSISFDFGETWEGPFQMPIPGCHRPVGGVLHSGNILMTYRFMQGGSGWLGKWTQNIFGAIFDQKSAKEKERNDQWSRIFPIDYDRSEESDLGYSGWVQFEDGEIFIVNYIVDDAPKAYIRGYRLREEDLIL